MVCCAEEIIVHLLLKNYEITATKSQSNVFLLWLSQPTWADLSHYLLQKCKCTLTRRTRRPALPTPPT